MAFLAECAGVGVGVPVIRCAAAATHYVFGWAVAVVFLLVVYFNLDNENTKDRVATTLFVTAMFVGVITALGLTPTIAYAYVGVLAVIGVILQLFTRS